MVPGRWYIVLIYFECTCELLCICLSWDCNNVIMFASFVYFPLHKTMATSSNGKLFHVTGPYAGNSPVTGEFPARRPATRRFDVFFDLRLNKRLIKQWWGWWFETASHPLWRHCHGSRPHKHAGMDHVITGYFANCVICIILLVVRL